MQKLETRLVIEPDGTCYLEEELWPSKFERVHAETKEEKEVLLAKAKDWINKRP